MSQAIKELLLWHKAASSLNQISSKDAFSDTKNKQCIASRLSCHQKQRSRQEQARSQSRPRSNGYGGRIRQGSRCQGFIQSRSPLRLQLCQRLCRTVQKPRQHHCRSTFKPIVFTYFTSVSLPSLSMDLDTRMLGLDSNTALSRAKSLSSTKALQMPSLHCK